MQPAIGPPPTATAAVSGRVPQLPFSRLTAQLQARLVQHPVAVHAARGQLSPIGIQWQIAVQRDPRGTLDERSGLAVRADAERLQPRQGEEGEAVVEFGDVQVGGSEVGPRPHLGRRIDRRHLREVLPVEPAARAVRSADRLDRHRGIRAVGGVLRSGYDERDRPVNRHVAVVQSEWVRYRPGRQVVGHGHRVPVCGKRIQSRVATAVDREPAQLLLGGAVALHVAPTVHRDPVRRGIGVRGQQVADVVVRTDLPTMPGHAWLDRRRGQHVVRLRSRRRLVQGATEHRDGAIHQHVARPSPRRRLGRPTSPGSSTPRC